MREVGTGFEFWAKGSAKERGAREEQLGYALESSRWLPNASASVDGLRTWVSNTPDATPL